MLSDGANPSLRVPPQEAPGTPASVPHVVVIVLATVALPLLVALAFTLSTETRVVAAVLGVMGVCLILAQPFCGLVLFVGLLYVRPEEVIPELAGSRVALIIALATLVGTWFRTFLRREQFVRTPMAGMILMFGLAAVLSTVRLGNTPETAQYFAKLVLLVLLILNLVRTPEAYRTFVTVVLLFTGYMSAYSSYEYFTGGALVMQGIERSLSTGIFSDPNDLAGTVVPGLALLATRLPSSRGLARFGYVLLGALFLWAIFLTNSRSGMIALLAVMVGIPIVFLPKYRGAAVIFGLMLALGLFVAGPSRMTNFDSSERSANQRFWHWSDGFHQFLSSPITGLGYDQYSEYNNGRTAHSTFVLCFTELGLLGYFFFMGCLYYAFRPRTRSDTSEELPETSWRDLMGARLALMGFLVSGLFLSRTYIQALYVFMSLPIACQVAAYGRGEALRLKAGERMLDWALIAALCGASILGIKVIADLYK